MKNTVTKNAEEKIGVNKSKKEKVVPNNGTEKNAKVNNAAEERGKMKKVSEEKDKLNVSGADKEGTKRKITRKRKKKKTENRMNKANIGRNIQVLRSALGFNQTQLAEMLDVSPIHLSHVETGKVGISTDLLLGLCKYLSVTPNDILNGEYESQGEVNPTLSFFEKSPYLSENDQELLLDITGLLARKNRENESGKGKK